MKHPYHKASSLICGWLAEPGDYDEKMGEKLKAADNAITEEELKDIKCRNEKATKGPWCVDIAKGPRKIEGKYNNVSFVTRLNVRSKTQEVFTADRISMPDIEFILRSREYIPKLLAYIQELEDISTMLASRCEALEIKLEDRTDVKDAKTALKEATIKGTKSWDKIKSR